MADLFGLGTGPGHEQPSIKLLDKCRWFNSLISKADNVKPAKKLIRKLGAVDIREIEMKQGNKITRVLAWTFI
ncbi:RlmF-related methyltransferase [Marinobacter sp. ATCH36]|uniref:RlmF-related methyltransferase n=1 Tax=Marinobacter sp. ATCH36 TaxID=2945106 RepID=UPI0020210CF1|nr:RlmF-related methyltransferase [Marinobacter sp. ATCH36]